MIIGILKEIKTEQNRVSMTPAGVEVMVQHGHAVLVKKRAGILSGFEDDAYVRQALKRSAPRKKSSGERKCSCM